MSLIIKGLDMPNKGYLTEITDVTIRQFADGKIQIEIPKTSMPYYRLYEAIQIPKGHGKVGDIDYIEDNIIEYGDLPVDYLNTDFVISALEDAPYLLEAEE